MDDRRLSRKYALTKAPAWYNPPKITNNDMPSMKKGKLIIQKRGNSKYGLSIMVLEKVEKKSSIFN